MIMKNKQLLAMAASGALLLCAPFAKANNITTEDNNTGSVVGSTAYTEQSSGWYKGDSSGVSSPLTPHAAYVAPNPGQSEYQEVEPGMQTGASWDLAAFVNPTNSGALGIVSGYNLAGGKDGTTIGDIFVNTQSALLTTYPDPNADYQQYTTNADFNYDYAIHMDFGAGTFTVKALDANTVLENGEYSSQNYNAASQPFKVATSHATPSQNYGTTIYTGSLIYHNNESAATASALTGYTVTGDYHYYAQVDLSWLTGLSSGPLINPLNATVSYKLTMSCGNDNMTGTQTTGFKKVPDGGASIALLGLGLLSMVGFARFKRRLVRR
jgi:hypothetical protein